MCTLPYAPPEAINADRDREDLTVAPSLDIWALGVIVFEALTGQPPFPPCCGSRSIAACAAGETPYPWETGVGEVPEAWTNARMHELVAPCLSRDPAQRPSAQALLEALRLHAELSTAG